MVSFTSLFAVALVASSTALALVTPKVAEQPVITYLGTQGPILCMPDQLTLLLSQLIRRLASGAFTTKGIVYTAGTVPSLNGTIVTGGIKNQTVCHPRSFMHLPLS